MKALVTGAAGFIGHHLVDALIDKGWKVCGLDDFSTGLPARITKLKKASNFTFYEGDVTDENLVKRIAKDCDVIFHQAAVPSVPRSWSEPLWVTRSNCLGTTSILEAAKQSDVKRVVVASSSSIYGQQEPTIAKSEDMCPDPQSPYALTKLWTEKLALQYGQNFSLKAIALRYFNVFGPGQEPTSDYAAVIPKFIKRMNNGSQPVIYGDGEQTRDFTYISNVVGANIAAATRGVCTAVYNVGAGEQHSVKDLVHRLNRLLNTDLKPVHDDPRPGDVRHSLADLERIRNELGYEPEVDFDEGLCRTVAALQGG